MFQKVSELDMLVRIDVKITVQKLQTTLPLQHARLIEFVPSGEQLFFQFCWSLKYLQRHFKRMDT